MADAADDKMVLRTIYLPLELDRRLRSLAFSRSISKANLMRGFIEDGLAKIAQSGERTLEERLSAQAAGGTAEVVEKPSASEIKRSITPDALISFIDGRPYKTLKRHLSVNGLDPESYRVRYALPPDYPTVSANYSAQRSALAKDIGLGQQRRQPAAATETKPSTERAKASAG